MATRISAEIGPPRATGHSLSLNDARNDHLRCLGERCLGVSTLRRQVGECPVVRTSRVHIGFAQNPAQQGLERACLEGGDTHSVEQDRGEGADLTEADPGVGGPRDGVEAVDVQARGAATADHGGSERGGARGAQAAAA